METRHPSRGWDLRGASLLAALLVVGCGGGSGEGAPGSGRSTTPGVGTAAPDPHAAHAEGGEHEQRAHTEGVGLDHAATTDWHGGHDGHHQHDSHGGHAGHAEMADSLPADAPVRGVSLYDLDLNLTDSDGQPRTLASFRGTPLSIVMLYTSCTAACPMLVADLLRFDQQLPQGAKVHHLIVSLDPERDDVAALAALRDRHHLDKARFTVARADDEGVRQLAVALGVRYRKLADGSINHSSVLTLLDANGAVAERTDGLRADQGPIVAAARGMGL